MAFNDPYSTMQLDEEDEQPQLLTDPTGAQPQTTTVAPTAPTQEPVQQQTTAPVPGVAPPPPPPPPAPPPDGQVTTEPVQDPAPHTTPIEPVGTVGTPHTTPLPDPYTQLGGDTAVPGGTMMNTTQQQSGVPWEPITDWSKLSGTTQQYHPDLPPGVPLNGSQIYQYALQETGGDVNAATQMIAQLQQGTDSGNSLNFTDSMGRQPNMTNLTNQLKALMQQGTGWTGGYEGTTGGSPTVTGADGEPWEQDMFAEYGGAQPGGQVNPIPQPGGDTAVPGPGASPIPGGGDTAVPGGQVNPIPQPGGGQGGTYQPPAMPNAPGGMPEVPDFQSAVDMPALPDMPDFNAPNAPGQTDMYGKLEDYASNWMDNPNRYLSDLATKTREEADLRLREKEQQGQRGIEEWAGSRGLVGSSYEGDQQVGLQESMARARSEEERAMLQMLATAETQDRQAAGNLGLGTAQLGEQAQQFRSQFELDVEKSGFQAAMQKVQMQQQDSLARADLNFKAALAGDQAAMDRVRHELDVMKAMDSATLSREQLQMQDREINLRAEALRQQNDALTADQARWQAELAFRKEEAARNQKNVDKDFDWNQYRYEQEEAQRQAEIARQLGINVGGGIGPGTTAPPAGQSAGSTGPETPYNGGQQGNNYDDPYRRMVDEPL